MSLFRPFASLRREEDRDLLSEAVAALVCENLAALGLHIEAKRYGRFHEIRASTSREIVTEPGNQTASGIMLLLARAFDPPTLVFQEINAIERGLGRRMVAAAMAALRAHPGAFARVKVNDLSPFQKDGRRWWENVADDYGDLAWLITHESDTMVTRAAGDEAVNSATLGDQDITRSPHFLRMQDNLAAFARAFGYDAGKVSLSPKKKIFDYLGQRFVSEGEALPDGRIVIYYDPEMSDARLGCCVAHEIQHARYFALRDAHALEHGDGPLSRRFAHYTPERLAAERGVSDYSNEHWDAWKGAAPPRLFSDELAEGGSEPINETLADVAKAYFNWGPDVRLSPLWKELHDAINEEYARLTALKH